MNKSVLVIGDTHSPYHHPDALAFLKAIKKKYKPDRTIHIGDELDFHFWSYHEADPDLMWAWDELKEWRKFLHKLEKIFPTMDLLESNHGSMAWRKAKTAGLSKEVLKSYRDVIFPEWLWEWWNWHPSLDVTLSNWENCHFCHQAEANIVNHAWHYWTSMVAWHRHSKADIWYCSSPYSLRFWMHVWCLIDWKSLAFAYNKLQKKRPILSVGLIINGVPMLQPMFLDKDWNWIWKL